MRTSSRQNRGADVIGQGASPKVTTRGGRTEQFFATHAAEGDLEDKKPDDEGAFTSS